MVTGVTEHVAETVRSLRGDGRGWVLLVVAFGWLLTAGGLVTVPALLPFIKDSFSLSNTTAGLAVSVMWAGYALLQFPAGLLTDAVGERLTLAASLGAGALSMLAFALTPVYGVFVLACGLFGLGSGLYATPRVTVLSATFPRNDGTALGVTMSSGSLGSAVLPFAAGLIAAAYDWRLGFAVVLPLFLAGAAGSWLVLPRSVRPEESAVDISLGHLVRRLLSVAGDRGVVLLVAAVMCTFFIFQGFTAFFTTYLVSEKGIDPATAATLFGAFFAAAAVSQPLAGNLADAVGEKPVLVGITAGYAAVLAAVPFGSGTLGMGLLAVLLGSQRGSAPVMNAYLASVLPSDVKGAGYGLFRTVFTGVASAGPVVVGVLADAGQFDGAFWLLAALAAVATLLYALLPAREPVA